LAAGAGARAQGGRVDEDEEAGLGEVGVGQVGENGLDERISINVREVCSERKTYGVLRAV